MGNGAQLALTNITMALHLLDNKLSGMSSSFSMQLAAIDDEDCTFLGHIDMAGTTIVQLLGSSQILRYFWLPEAHRFIAMTNKHALGRIREVLVLSNT